MAKKQKRITTVCKNHPDRKTRRRCYQCKEYICTECTIRYDHHFFCSQNCIKTYKKSQKKSSRKLTKKKNKKIKLQFSLSDAVYLLLILILTFLLIQKGLKQQKMNSSISFDSFPPRQVDSLWKPIIYGGSLEYIVEGEFPKDRAIGVWINDIYYNTLTKPKRLKIPISILHSGENEIIMNAITPDTSYQVYHTTFLWNMLPFRRLDLNRIPIKGKFIALTFDAGSNDGAVDSVVAILQKYHIRATAFLTGFFIKKYPNKVKKLIQSGVFDFGNHTFSHPHLTSYAKNFRHETLSHVNFEFLKKELTKTDSLFYARYHFHLSPIWRAPFGEYNVQILNWAGHLGYIHIGWSRGFDTFDWVKDTTSKIYYTPEKLWEKWVKTYQSTPEKFNGAIILMHLGNERIKPMYKMLHDFIPFMLKEGYHFVTIPQVLEYKRKLASKNSTKHFNY